jgi:hypothetical protein
LAQRFVLFAYYTVFNEFPSSSEGHIRISNKVLGCNL